MRIKRTLTILAAILFTTTVATTAYGPAASAASTVECYYIPNVLICDSSNGAQTIWYVNGVRQSASGASATFNCLYGKRYTISVNTGTSLAATWSGYCMDY